MHLITLLLACSTIKGKSDTAATEDTADNTVEDTGNSDTSEPTDTAEPTDSADTADTSDTSDTGTAQDSIFDIQQGLIPVGTQVTITDAVVSSPATEYGFYIANPSGGAHSGLFVYYYFDEAIALNIQQGDVITVSGEVWEYPDTCEDNQDNDNDGLVDTDDPDCAEGGQEADLTTYQTMTEIKLLDPGDISKTGSFEGDLTVTVVDSSVLASLETAEPYEGVLVRIENGVVTEEQTSDGRWAIDGVWVDDLFDVEPGLVNAGDTFDAVQGILHFSYDSFKIVPRTSSDLSGWNRTCEGERWIWDVTEGELIITEFMADPDNDGACSDSTSEYVEIVYNPTATQSLDIRGLQLADSGSSKVIGDHVVLSPGDHAWISVGTQSCYGLANVQLGSTSFSLNQGGDSIALSYQDIDGSVSTFDSVSYTADWVESGVSIQLEPSSTDATANDDLGNWCMSTEAIGTTSDLGTPGQTNTPCQ